MKAFERWISMIGFLVLIMLGWITLTYAKTPKEIPPALTISAEPVKGEFAQELTQLEINYRGQEVLKIKFTGFERDGSRRVIFHELTIPPNASLSAENPSKGASAFGGIVIGAAYVKMSGEQEERECYDFFRVVTTADTTLVLYLKKGTAEEYSISATPQKNRFLLRRTYSFKPPMAPIGKDIKYVVLEGYDSFVVKLSRGQYTYWMRASVPVDLNPFLLHTN